MKLRNEGFSIYTIIIVLGFLGLVFVLSLPKFFDLESKEHRNQCIKNMKQIYNACENYMLDREESFNGTALDLKRTNYLKESMECPAGKVGDKYFIEGIFQEGQIKSLTVECFNQSQEEFKDHKLPESFLKYDTNPTENDE